MAKPELELELLDLKYLHGDWEMWSLLISECSKDFWDIQTYSFTPWPHGTSRASGIVLSLGLIALSIDLCRPRGPYAIAYANAYAAAYGVTYHRVCPTHARVARATFW